MANQFLSGFEKENFYECPQCSEAITNPLCHNCLGKEVSKWLGFYPSVKRIIMPKIKKYINQVNNEATGALSCVACKNKKAALCPYCFTEGIFNILRKDRINVHVIGDFLSVFNFDLDKSGYFKDAEESGLY